MVVLITVVCENPFGLEMGYKKLIIRSYDGKSDRAQVEDLERRCEVGPTERVFLFTDTMGDPMCRIRNSPMYKMLVAQLDNELVGVIQGSIKIVTVHKPPLNLAKVGYVLGLRVAPFHRRRGIGSSLVAHMEEWFLNNDVDYSYMATEKDNEASVRLFVQRLGYTKFRTPTILVNPVTPCRPYHISSGIEIARLKVEEAESLYKNYMHSTEFFPHDIDSILRNKLSLGTWVAYFRGDKKLVSKSLAPGFQSRNSWAMVSVWNSGELFKLRLGKAPLSCLICTESSKLIHKIFPCFKLPLMPDFFHPFGFYFIYGVHREGPLSGKLLRALCQDVHNMAAKSCRDCKVVVTEIGGEDELKEVVPHWKLLSCAEDLWCIKALKRTTLDSFDELINAPAVGALFVDPREV